MKESNDTNIFGGDGRSQPGASPERYYCRQPMEGEGPDWWVSERRRARGHAPILSESVFLRNTSSPQRNVFPEEMPPVVLSRDPDAIILFT